MKNILKGLILALLPGVVFALHGKIVFYDGTYVVGKVTKVDESSVYIVPIGLDTAEGVLVGNIDSLKVENGMVPVVNSSVKYFYQNGEFMANDSDWMDEYDDFKYNEYTSLQEEYSIIAGNPIVSYFESIESPSISMIVTFIDADQVISRKGITGGESIDFQSFPL